MEVDKDYRSLFFVWFFGNQKRCKMNELWLEVVQFRVLFFGDAYIEVV